MFKLPKAKIGDIIIVDLTQYKVLEATTIKCFWCYNLTNNKRITENEIKYNLTTKKNYIKKVTKETIEIIKYCTEKEFNEFWNLYPKKNNRKINKSKCIDLYTRLPLKTHRSLLQGLEILKSSESWLKGYHPNTTTFLNQKRWEDVSKENTESKTEGKFCPSVYLNK